MKPQRLQIADGETIAAQERREVVVLTEREELTITWSRYAGGEHGTDLHVHREHIDAFYILEGELSFALGPSGDRFDAPPGSFVAVPPNVVHGFSNRSDGEARWLNLHAPDKNFANYLRGLRDGNGVAEWPPDGPDPETAVAAADGVRHTFAHEIGIVDAHAPDGGFADSLRALP